MAGRVASVLLVLAGAITMATVGLPEPAGFDRASVLVVGAVASVSGLVLLMLPWQRWSNRVSLVLVPPSLTLIALHNWFGGRDPFRYSIFFLVVFVWVGTYHPRGTPALTAVPTLFAYLTPLLAAHASASALSSAAYAIPVFILVGEILAWRSALVGQLERSLREAAHHDPLTGLANRRLLVDRLDRAVDRAARADHYVHVLYADVDEFKAINDTCGHDVGDSVLVTLAETLTAAVRPTDTVARFAGDEFVVVIESPDADSGTLAAQRVMAMLHQKALAHPPVIVPTVSIGVASARGSDGESVMLLQAADTALYAAKQGGKDRMVDWSAELSAAVGD